MKEITNEDLARIIQSEMETLRGDMEQRFSGVDQRFKKVENDLATIKAQGELTQATLVNHMDAEAVHRGQLEQRVAVIEKQLGIETLEPAIQV